ncbi:MAG: class I SAM-dependent methyltransferase [Gammaproteobacteria bacterium]
MHLIAPTEPPLRNELDLIAEHVPLDGTRVLELGCGAARMTRALASHFNPRSVIATEVDRVQLDRNLALGDVPDTIRFRYGGAERIDYPDGHFDRVFMFKSLHHVPTDRMEASLAEIARVLRPGGLAWFSEPVYDGDFNALMSLFHDEKTVREAAFKAIRGAIDGRLFSLEHQLFFKVERQFSDFAQFEERMIGVTHTELRLTPDTLARVRARFESFADGDGARFEAPMRVDLLRRI